MGNQRWDSEVHESQKTEFFCTKLNIFGTKSRKMMIRSALERFMSALNVSNYCRSKNMAPKEKDGCKVHKSCIFSKKYFLKNEICTETTLT